MTSLHRQPFRISHLVISHGRSDRKSGRLQTCTQVLAEVSLESKNAALSEGIYNFFASEYGVSQHSKQRRRQDKLAKALNVAKKEKNDARRMLQQAKATRNKSTEETTASVIPLT